MKKNTKLLIIFMSLLFIGLVTTLMAYDFIESAFGDTKNEKIEKGAYLVGISNYKFPADEDDYLYAAEDAQNMKNLLQSNAGFNENNTLFKSDEMASKSEIENDLNNLDDNQTKKDIFIFYFAGHGDVSADENSYIIYPYDADEYDTIILKGSELQKFMNGIHADKIICIFDCCESGGLIEDITENSSNSSKYIILTACNKGESSMEMIELNEGIFTHYLIEAFKTKAVDTNNNSWISFEEAFKYAKNKTIKYGEVNGDLQHPQIFDGNPNKDVDLVQISN